MKPYGLGKRKLRVGCPCCDQPKDYRKPAKKRARQRASAEALRQYEDEIELHRRIMRDPMPEAHCD